MNCSICATADFRPPDREFDLALRCDTCDITFCFRCAGRKSVDTDIVAFCCPNDNSHSIADAPTEIWVVSLDIVPTFVWRPEMTCLVPVDGTKTVPELCPGDCVLFNKRSGVVTEIRPYR